MKTKFYKSEKFQGVFFPILYFLLSVAIVVTGCVIFYNKYYQPIIVTGPSMLPTLVGGTSAGELIDGHPVNYRSHYGIADLHKSAVNNLKRFDVCVTKYPAGWAGDETSSIIKRVWGFPGETINLSYDSSADSYTFTVTKDDYHKEYKAPVLENVERKYECEYTVGDKTYYTTITKTFARLAKFNLGNKVFYVNASTSRTFPNKTLEKDEYFVMGDNWSSSLDSFVYINDPVKLTKGNLQGKAICINAYATYVDSTKEITNIHKFKARYFF